MSEVTNEQIANDLINLSSNNEIQKKQSIEEKFDIERNEWLDKIRNLTEKMKDIFLCSEVLVETLSERQVAVDKTHMLMHMLSKINADLRDKKRERFIYYTQNYDQRLDKSDRENFINADLRKQVLLQELFSNHLSYMRSTVDTLSNLYYGVSTRLKLEEYKRSQH